MNRKSVMYAAAAAAMIAAGIMTTVPVRGRYSIAQTVHGTISAAPVYFDVQGIEAGQTYDLNSLPLVSVSSEKEGKTTDPSITLSGTVFLEKDGASVWTQDFVLDCDCTSQSIVIPALLEGDYVLSVVLTSPYTYEKTVPFILKTAGGGSADALSAGSDSSSEQSSGRTEETSENNADSQTDTGQNENSSSLQSGTDSGLQNSTDSNQNTDGQSQQAETESSDSCTGAEETDMDPLPEPGVACS